MDKLDLSQATATKGQPLLNNSLEWIQGTVRSMIGNLSRTIVGKDNFDNNKFVVLYGMELTGTVIAAGAVYNPANNEIFIVQSVDTAGYSNIPVLRTDFRNDGSLDPITFSDNTTGNVHNIRLYQIVDAVSGSGVVDYADLVFLNNQRLRTKVVNIGDWDMDATASVNVAHGLTSTDIRSVQVWIREDVGPAMLPMTYNQAGTPAGYFSFDNTNVILNRLAAGVFDSTSYNATSFNRGYITIEYVM
jgi:hypothetical protein